MDSHATAPAEPAGAASVEASPDMAALRAEADALRDAGRWQAAAAAYAAYLQHQAQDWPIWVQYGHCVKEAGHPEAALRLYRQAAGMAPGDADLRLQIGHALKLLRRPEEAREAYAEALALDPGLQAARAELAALLPPSPEPALPEPVAPPLPPLGIAIDVSDFLAHVQHGRAPSGIQRVLLALLGELLPDAAGQGIGAAALDPASGCWKQLPAEMLAALARLSLAGGEAADAAWQDAVAQALAALRAAPEARFQPEACLVTLGAAWWVPGHMQRVAAARARHGLRFLAVVFDCIPAVAPEFCPPELVAEFAPWLAAVCLQADLVLLPSEAARGDFLRLQAALLPDHTVPTGLLRLDAAMAAAPADLLAAPSVRTSPRPYVLCVGTIEPRKDQLGLLQAWQALLRRHGPALVPDLVLVGRRGWMAEPAIALLEAAPDLRDQVQWLPAVPEAALQALYRGCLFTVCNSHQEGWGLPVTESLCFGKVPVVRHATSLPEAGGEAAVYVDPDDPAALSSVLEAMILDPAYRAAREAVVQAMPPLRRWADIAAVLLQHALSLRQAPPGPPARLRLATGLGRRHALALGPALAPPLAWALAAPDPGGWHAAESWGRWTRPGLAQLCLPPCEQAAATPLHCYLETRTPAADWRGRWRVLQNGEPATDWLDMPGSGQSMLQAVALQALPDAALVLEIEAAGPTTLPDGRAVGTGVIAVTLCRADDLLGRLQALEAGLLRLEAV